MFRIVFAIAVFMIAGALLSLFSIVLVHDEENARKLFIAFLILLFTAIVVGLVGVGLWILGI